MKIASWNLTRGLSDVNRADKAEEVIDRLDADIIFMPEAYNESGEPYNPGFAERLGYTALSTEYEDSEQHPGDKQYIVGLSRGDVSLEVSRLKTRNAIMARFVLQDQEISLIGAHFDDRSESLRLGMTEAFLKVTEEEANRALIGDLNSMHGEDLRARILSSMIAREAASKLKNDRRRSLATRLTDMATGTVMATLEQSGMVDADTTHSATMLMGRLAIVQLDHIMHSGNLVVSELQTQSVNGFDHRVISGQLSLI